MFKILKYLLIGIVVLGVIGALMGKDNGSNSSNSSSSSTPVQEAPKDYAEADIDVLLRDVKNNAAKANKDYNGKYVKIVGGRVSNIESGASYVSIEGSEKITLLHVQCYPNNQQTKDVIINLSKGQSVTVYGKIKDVGEIMGYSLDMDKIE